MLKCLIIPLVVPSLIVSVGSLKLSMTGKIGIRFEKDASVPGFSDSTTAYNIILQHNIMPREKLDRTKPRPSNGCMPNLFKFYSLFYYPKQHN